MIMRNKFYSKMIECMANLSILCIFFIFILWSENAYSQKQEGVVLVKSGTMGSIIESIEKQTKINFFYDANSFNTHLYVSIKNEYMTVPAILDYLLNNNHRKYNYVYNGKTVIIDNELYPKVTPGYTRIKGCVTNEKGYSMPGVTVKVGGSLIGVSTGANGWFNLEVPIKSGELEFSFVGYEKQVVNFKDGYQLMGITMKEKILSMEEVVVTGYGNISKGNYTGAATTVKAEDILMPGVTNIDQMLQGVIPGMLVWNTTGQVGASSKIRIRGTSTLLGNQEPVWVVDGVIQRDPQSFNADDNLKFSVDADDIKQLAGNAISWLNPNDIESITVLKDASATDRKSVV